MPKFQLGDFVSKSKGSSWRGRIVGTYSTALTPEGYCVESAHEPGSVQIYPASALELHVQGPVDATVPDRRHDPEIERRARQIYESWSDQPGYVPWVENGNSTRQDDARWQVMRVMRGTAPLNPGIFRTTGPDRSEEPLPFREALGSAADKRDNQGRQAVYDRRAGKQPGQQWDEANMRWVAPAELPERG